MRLATLAAAAGTAAGTAWAQTFTYQGPGGAANSPTTGVWSAGGNFAGGAAPTSGTDWTMSITHTSSAVTGGTGFESENDIANNFVLSALSLNNTISNSNVIKGSSIRFSDFTAPAAPAAISLAGTRGFSLDLNMSSTGSLNINQNGSAHLWLKRNLNTAGTVTVGGTGTGMVHFGVHGSAADHLSGMGSLVKNGAGVRLNLAGQSTYSGGTTLNAGGLRLDNSSTFTNGALVSGPLGVGSFAISGGYVVTDTQSPPIIHNFTSINGTAQFGSHTGDGAKAVMTFARGVSLTAAASTINVQRHSEVHMRAGVSQPPDVTASLTKLGFGSLYLNGDSSITGDVVVGAGQMYVGWAPSNATPAQKQAAKDATLGAAGAPLNSLTINASGWSDQDRVSALQGRGTIWVSKARDSEDPDVRYRTKARSGTTIMPGVRPEDNNLNQVNLPGVLTIHSDLLMEPGSIFEVTLNGPNAGDEDDNHSQLRLHGEVLLSGANLIPELNYIPDEGDVLYIINNIDPDDLTIGQFAQGEMIYLTSSVDGLTYPFGISYQANAAYPGSDLYGKITGGNDVALYSLVPTPGTLALLGLGLLAAARRRR